MDDIKTASDRMGDFINSQEFKKLKRPEDIGNKNIQFVNEEITELHNRIAALEASRYAYASEFPLDAEGQPDKGSIHENIRKLKAENKKLRVILMSASKKLSSSEDCSDLPQTLYNAALM